MSDYLLITEYMTKVDQLLTSIQLLNESELIIRDKLNTVSQILSELVGEFGVATYYMNDLFKNVPKNIDTKGLE